MSARRPPGHLDVNDDDLLSLPADGEPGAAAHRPGTAFRPELLALSSEARLATALLMQAQALDGLHRAHADVLRRLEGETGSGDAQRGLDELQQRLLGQLARDARRARRRRWQSAGFVLLVSGAAAWLLVSERQRLGASVAELQSSLRVAQDGQRAAIEQAVAAAVQRAGADEAAAIGQLESKFDAGAGEARARVDQLATERDSLQSQLAAAHGELDALRNGHDRTQQDLAAARDERNRQIGENAQLRQQVMDRDRRLDEIGHTLEDLQAAMAQPRPLAAAEPSIVTSSGSGGTSLPARANAALRSSGAADSQLLEAGGVSDGALLDVVVARPGADGKPRMLQAARARVVAENGRAWLRLEGAHLAGEPAGGVQQEDIELPALDGDAWRALGLQLPAGFTPLPRVKAALAALLAPQGYTVAELGSYDGQRLGALVIRQEDENGVPVRTLRADAAVLTPVGPELELHDGTITTGSDERAFFHGVCRVPLPGGDYGAWLAAVGGAAP